MGPFSCSASHDFSGRWQAAIWAGSDLLKPLRLRKWYTKFEP